MRRILVTGLVVIAWGLASAPSARAEAILTLSGLDLQAGANGELQLNVDVDLAGAASNLVGFDFDVLHAGLTYTGHTIGTAFDDQDPLTDDVFDFTLPDAGAERQNVAAGLNSPFLGSVTGRLFSMTFLVGDLANASLSLLGFPAAQDFEGALRSESLLTEVAPLDLQAVPFIILLTSSTPGEVTLRLTTAPPVDPPTTVPEPGSLLLTGFGLSAVALVRARRRRGLPQQTT